MNQNDFVFFDTETTGNTPDDVLCQIAYKCGDDIFCELYNPGRVIPPEASAVHHISNKMITDKPIFRESDTYAKVKTLFESTDKHFVAHNAKFDIGMFKREDIILPRFLCTLRLARALDEENKIPRYNLQYLRYYLDMDIEAQAHDALGDVMVLEQLFTRLYEKFLKRHSGDKNKTLAEMYEISSRPSFMAMFTFGKYNGQKVTDVARIDRGYLEWMLAQKMQNEADEEDWIYTLKTALGK